MTDTNTLPIETEDTQSGRFLTFTLGAESFGIEIKYVTEIVGIQPINTLPEVPSHIKGIINLRGKIIPVIDIRLKFKKEPVGYTDRTCIIVIDTNVLSVGLIVDNVAEVIGINEENTVPPPDVRTGANSRYMQGIGKTEGKIILLLDCKKLFIDDQCEMLEDVG